MFLRKMRIWKHISRLHTTVGFDVTSCRILKDSVAYARDVRAGAKTCQ